MKISGKSETAIVQMALASELYARRKVFDALVHAGHVKVVLDCEPAHIRVQCDDETFTDERARFPTITLMAKLQLAVAAGRSCRSGLSDHVRNAIAYGCSIHQAIDRIYRPISMDEFTETYERADRKVDRKTLDVTATVKPKVRPQRQKGLRP